MGREPKSHNPAPTGWDFSEFDIHSFIDGYRSVTEAYSFAEALDTLGTPAIKLKLDVFTVNGVEEDGPAFHGGISQVTWNNTHDNNTV